MATYSTCAKRRPKFLPLPLIISILPALLVRLNFCWTVLYCSKLLSGNCTTPAATVVHHTISSTLSHNIIIIIMFPRNSTSFLQSVLQKTATTASSRAAVTAGAPPRCRSMSSTAKVWIDKNTRVICQGFTGKQVRLFLVPSRDGHATYCLLLG